jgi:tetratricopeptide (TPR) repeat protein
MKWTGWVLAGAIAATPVVARAQAVLDKPHHILGQGVSLVVAGRYADAERKLREALRENPSMPEGHYNLGVALREQGRNDEAIAELQEALRGFSREEDRAKALYGIGLAKEARGDKDAWDDYLAFARPLRDQQSGVQIAEQHRDVLTGVQVPGTRKAAR